MKELFKIYSSFFESKEDKKSKKIKLQILKYVLFIPFLMFSGFVVLLILSMKDNAGSKIYRTSPNYKKVIKEGVLFDTVEYHER